MSEPVDTSAEAVDKVASILEWIDADGGTYLLEKLDEAAALLRALAAERAELQRAHSEAAAHYAATFAASDAYQRRCEQGDALLLDSLAALTFVHMEVLDGQEGNTSQLLARIKAHLAGESKPFQCICQNCGLRHGIDPPSDGF